MGAMAYYAARNRRILLIHGYNVEERAGQDSMHWLRGELIEGCRALAPEILTVTWPGNKTWLKGGPAAYFKIVPVAAEAGRLLYEALMAEARINLDASEIVIVAHSLACRLTLEFLRHLDRASRPPRLKKVVAILMAAAVPSDMSDLIAAARRNADEIIVLHSKDDKVLRKWFRRGQTAAREGWFPEAIGFEGNPHDPPWSYHQPMAGYDHGDYWKSRSTADVIGKQLSAYFPDVTYRAADLRRPEIYERPTLGETSALPEHSLPDS